MRLYDVAVVGGGPVGSWLAHRMAGMGYEVVVIDKKQGLDEPVCCTGIISKECVNYYHIDERLIFREASRARVFSPSGKLLDLERPEPQACIVDRAAFNAASARNAIDSGAEYVLDSPVSDILLDGDRIAVEVKPGDRDRTSHYNARAVVVANGANDKLVAKLGLSKTGDQVVGVQAEVKVDGLDEVEVYFGHDFAPEFFAWLVPTLPGKGLVGLLSRKTAGSNISRFISLLQARGRITSQESELRYGAVPLGLLDRSYGDRLLVVGSAAGQVKPLTGGGIYYGLLCADIAADSLHRALQSGELSARQLAGYEKAWKKRLGSELGTSYWARRLYGLLSDAHIDRIFDIISENGIDRALLEADDLSFDWHGRAVLRLMGQKALERFLKTLKIPFSFRNTGES